MNEENGKKSNDEGIQKIDVQAVALEIEACVKLLDMCAVNVYNTLSGLEEDVLSKTKVSEAFKDFTLAIFHAALKANIAAPAHEALSIAQKYLTKVVDEQEKAGERQQKWDDAVSSMPTFQPVAPECEHPGLKALHDALCTWSESSRLCHIEALIDDLAKDGKTILCPDCGGRISLPAVKSGDLWRGNLHGVARNAHEAELDS